MHRGVPLPPTPQTTNDHGTRPVILGLTSLYSQRVHTSIGYTYEMQESARRFAVRTVGANRTQGQAGVYWLGTVSFKVPKKEK